MAANAGEVDAERWLGCKMVGMVESLREVDREEIQDRCRRPSQVCIDQPAHEAQTRRPGRWLQEGDTRDRATHDG